MNTLTALLTFTTSTILAAAAGAQATGVKPESSPSMETIRATAELPAPVGDVWDALTTQAGLEGWLAPHADIDLKIGGLLRAQMDSKLTLESPGTRAQKVACFEPWKLLSLSFQALDTDPAPVKTMAGGVTNIFVEAGKTGEPGTTKVTFAWTGPLTTAEKKDYAPQQSMILKSKVESLTKYFEGRKPTEGATTRPGRHLTQVFTIQAPVARVWDAFTSKAEMESWMTPLAEVDLRAGGTIRTHGDKKAKIGDPGTVVQNILTLEPHRVLAFQSIAPADAPNFIKTACQAWSVLWFEPAGADATKLTLTGVNYGQGPEWDQAYKFFESGNKWTMQQLDRKYAPAKK